MKIECEDMPLTPVVWNGRLFLFWPKIFKQAAMQTLSLPSGHIADVDLGQLQTAAQQSVQSQSQNAFAIQAALCWSEFYNSKWQTTKTSDVNRPTTIAQAGSDAANSFDMNRNLWRIEPQAFGNALGLRIYSAINGVPPPAPRWPHRISWSGFYMFNTHSLPITYEDHYVAYRPPSQYRWPHSVAPYTGGGADTLSIDYMSSSSRTTWTNIFSNNLLTAGVGTRHLGPQLSSGWDAPFFFEDRRNVFYVTTSESWVPINDFPYFGVVSTTPVLQGTIAYIPPLVTPRAPKLPDRGDPVFTTGTGSGDPGVLQSFIGANPTIRAAFGSGMTISYQGRQIGSSSSVDIAAQSAGADGSAPS